MSNTLREGIFWAKSAPSAQHERDRRQPARGQEAGAAVAVLDAPSEGTTELTPGVAPIRRDERR